MNGSRGEAEGAVEDGLLALGGVAAEGDAHALHTHDFQDIEACLLEKVIGAAVDSHAAADLVDETEFFVGVGELSGEGIEFAFEAGEAYLVAQHVEKHAGLTLHGLIVEGGSFLGLLIEPDSVEAEAAADADDIFAELEGGALGGEDEDADELAALDVRESSEDDSGEMVPDRHGGRGGESCQLLFDSSVGRIVILEHGQDVSLEE